MRKTKENEENKLFMKLFGVLDEKKWMDMFWVFPVDGKKLKKKKRKKYK